MHASFSIGDSEIMASDGECRGRASFQGFSLSLPASSEAEAKRTFAALSEGGQVQLPPSKTFFSPCFAMLSDRFGVGWMIIVPPEQA
jgi:PhnB protein